MLDLLITNATLPDGRTGIDIACAQGKIADIGHLGMPGAHRTIDARGHLVSPPFVDAHFHMDATLSLGIPRLNKSGTLLEGISRNDGIARSQDGRGAIDARSRGDARHFRARLGDL